MCQPRDASQKGVPGPRRSDGVRLRTLLIVVGLVAFGLGGFVGIERILKRRSHRLALAFRYAQIAENDANFSGYHAAQAKILEEDAEHLSNATTIAELRKAAAQSRTTARRYAQKASHYLQLERRLQYAADHPWQPLPRAIVAVP